VGWHSNQFGAVRELTPVALPDDPLDVAAGAVVDRAADWAPLDPLPDTAPVLAVPDEDPFAASDVDDAVAVELAGFVAEAAVVVAPVARLTTPFCVTVPGVAAVCAAAGNATATESNIA
jgi:hypothetical protein